MRIEADVAYNPKPECLDKGRGDCSSNVEYRMALSSTGVSFPRCDNHWTVRLHEQEKINERYPDSPIPPPDFDPDYAGEVWNDEN